VNELENKCLIMKKKMQDMEDNRQVSQEKTSENEVNTEKNIVNENNTQQEQSSAGTENIEAAADKVVSEVRAVEEKLAEMQDKYLRLSAEFDNYRKRTLKEKMELSKYAEENILSKIIPFMDDFERALQHIDSATDDSEAMKDGINLIYMKFSEFLKQNGVKEIDSVNTDFNVDLHEAVAKIPVEDSKKGKVVDVALKGYYLRDKVLRHAKVVVGE
jgi:molecular chaperone GrpE